MSLAGLQLKVKLCGLVQLPAIQNIAQPGSRVHTKVFFVVSDTLGCTDPENA